MAALEAGTRLTIEQLGSRGEGVARTERGPVFVPVTLPGETVMAQVAGDRADVLERLTDSPARIAPFCPVHGTCGGCVTQHMAPALYEGWKRELVVRALRTVHLEPPVAALVPAGGDGRRRVTLHSRRINGAIRVGFMQARTHELLPLDACPVLVPALAPAFRVATRVATALAGRGKPLDIQLTATEGGLDVDVRGHGALEDDERLALTRAAEALDLARLSNHGEVIIERRLPFLLIGGVRVVPPPGSFLQATTAGEEALVALVLAAVASAPTPVRRVADLFAGCGPFALRLGSRAAVLAVDDNAAAIRALDRAAREAGLGEVKTAVRDLMRRPLQSDELEGLDAVVFDPPRAGAQAQAEALAASAVPLVLAVSCNAGTFARDAAVLAAGGYRLTEVTPVDQFAHTPHVEMVGVFQKPRPTKQRRRFSLG
jgi:23S rRNA (uracil1939-C5)-methyltransferase